ncbi:MAG: DUF3592 domain-containing protein [Halobacteriales archaeon]
MNFSVNGPSGSLRIVVVLVLGLATMGYGVYSYNAQTSALDSPAEVDATVSSTSVEENAQRRGVSYTPQATFTYTYEGDEYTSSNVYPGTLSREFGTEDAAQEALNGYEGGETVTAYVPPESPGSAYLKHESSNKPFLVIGFGVLFVLASLYSAVRS